MEKLALNLELNEDFTFGFNSVFTFICVIGFGRELSNAFYLLTTFIRLPRCPRLHVHSSLFVSVVQWYQRCVELCICVQIDGV